VRVCMLYWLGMIIMVRLLPGVINSCNLLAMPY